MSLPDLRAALCLCCLAWVMMLFGPHVHTAAPSAPSAPPGRTVEFQRLRFRVSDSGANKLAVLIRMANIGSAFNRGQYCLNRACEKQLSVFVVSGSEPPAYSLELGRLDAAYDPHRDAIYLHPSLIEPVRAEDWTRCLAFPAPIATCGPTYYLAFLLFHELGHRALGSRLRVMFHYASGYSLEQMDEIDADAWGLHHLASALFPGSKALQAEVSEAVVRAAIVTYFAEVSPLDRISAGHPSMLVRLQSLSQALTGARSSQGSVTTLLSNLIAQTEAHRRFVLRTPPGLRLADAAVCGAGFVAVSQTRHVLVVLRARAESAYWGNFLAKPDGGGPKTWRDYADLEFRDVGEVLAGVPVDPERLRIQCDGEDIAIMGAESREGETVSEVFQLTPRGIQGRRTFKTPACVHGVTLGFLSSSGSARSARACLAGPSSVDIALADEMSGMASWRHLKIPPGIEVRRNALIAMRSGKLLLQTRARDSWELLVITPGNAPARSLVKTDPAFWEVCLGKLGLAAIGGDPEGTTLAAAEFRDKTDLPHAHCGYQQANQVARTAAQLLAVLRDSASALASENADRNVIAMSDAKCELLIGARSGSAVWVFAGFGHSGISQETLDAVDGCQRF